MNLTKREHEYVTVVEVPSQFEPYLAAALLRVQVLFPALTFRRNGTDIAIGVTGSAEKINVRKALLHAVYREKVYAETLSMRQDLVSAVTTR